MQINDANQLTDKSNNKIILDIKTFFLKLIDNNNYSNSNSIYYNSYFSMINDCETIILLIDHDFINNFEYLKKNYLEKYKIKVIIVELSVYIAILENIKKKNFIKGDEQDKDICTVKIKDNNILPGFKKGEYKFHLDNNLVTYFNKLQKFKTNISKKINDEILIYSPDNMAFQYLIKYIYIEKNENDDFIIINDENNLNNLNILSINLYSIKEIINSYNCKNNLYFIPIEFNDNTFSKIKEYFPHNITDELKYGKEISGFEDYIIEIIKNNKNDYFLKLLHSKKNYSPLYIKLKTIFTNEKKGDLIYEINADIEFNKPNYRRVIDINFPNEKILFFISNVFFMENFTTKKEILLLGDEIWQLKFYLTNIFKGDLLSITHVTRGDYLGAGQKLGFIKTIYRGTNISEFLKKFKDKPKDLLTELKNEIIKEDLLKYFDLFKSPDEKPKKYDIVFIDENFVDIEKSLTKPSFNIFKEKIGLFKNMINEEGIIGFNLIGKSKKYYELVKTIIKNNNFIILKDEKEYCNGYFIITKSSKVINYARNNKKEKIFDSKINLNIEKFIDNFLSKNEEI